MFYSTLYFDKEFLLYSTLVYNHTHVTPLTITTNDFAQPYLNGRLGGRERKKIELQVIKTMGDLIPQTLMAPCRQCSRSRPVGSSVYRLKPDWAAFLTPESWFSRHWNSSTVVEASKLITWGDGGLGSDPDTAVRVRESVRGCRCFTP